MRWHVPATQHADCKSLARKLGVSETLASLLLQRGFTDADAADRFLRPSLSNLSDPLALTNLDAAVERLRLAMKRGESVTVIGDYDVDGVTSTTLMVDGLREFGLSPRYIVPRRIDEGYGLSQPVLERMLADGKPDVLLVLDCGTNSVDEVAALRELAIDVIIIDHHRSKTGIPQDCVLVNPHVFDPPDSPWQDLSTVGLTFKLLHGLVKKLRLQGDPIAQALDLRQYLDLVAMGTVADLVPLLDENRILTYHGLRRLRESSRQGINALFQVSGMRLGQQVRPTDISFRLGPRINASGRIADAALPVEMLLAKDFHQCLDAAQQLESFNRERQDIEREVTEQAIAMVEQEQLDTAGIVVYHQDWHPGVVGIVAGKLARRYHKPAIVLGREGDWARGSGRSVAGVNLQKILARCDDCLREWGGHPMAVGVGLAVDDLESFRDRFSAAVSHSLDGDDMPEPEVHIQQWLQPDDLNTTLLEELELLHPFGQGNPQPVFGLRGITIGQPPELFGRQRNLRFSLATGNGASVPVIAWRQGDQPLPHDRPVDLALTFGWNLWNGRANPQAELVDWRPA